VGPSLVRYTEINLRAREWLRRQPLFPCASSDIPMDLEKFRNSLSQPVPPAGLTLALAGLWWDAKGDWTRAHESAQEDSSREGSWVHAYLHRKEGDDGNAAYWYSRAGKPVCRDPIDAEWLQIATKLLQ